MARTFSDEKAGYYPLDPTHFPLVAQLFAPGAGKILDPCAGEGAALDYLAQAWGLTPYANEINDIRYRECVTRFGALQAVQGDLRELRTSQNAFGVVYCNPPYSLDSTAEKSNKRTEFQLMKIAWKWVQAGGYMIWVVYDYHLYNNPHALEFLTYHSSRIEVFRLPGLHLNNYQQIVVVAQKRPTAIDASIDLSADIARLQEAGQNPRSLSDITAPVFTLPQPVTSERFLFAPAKLTADFALQAVQQAGVQQNVRFQKLITPPPPATLERPITLPKAAQILMLMVSGFTNGILLPLADGRTVLVRGSIQRLKAVTHHEEVLDNSSGNIVGVKQTLTTRPKSVVALLDEEGRVETLSQERDIVNFVEEHREALFKYVKTHYPPLYNFDYADLKPLLDGIRLPLKVDGRTTLQPLYTTQKHMICSAYTALQHRQRVLVAAEPGIGKTVLGVSLAVAIGKTRQPGQVVLMMAPPQLTGKWKREVERAHGLPPRYAQVLERVDEVRDFMNRATQQPTILHIGILSREMAKLGSGWQPALHWKKVHQANWRYGTEPPSELEGCARISTRYIPCCPSCSTEVQKSGERQPLTPSYFGYDPVKRTYDRQQGTRTQHTCTKCGRALYQVVRLKGDLPKAGAKFAPGNTRMALAEFIARVYPTRVALFIADECHELKSIASDQGKAMTHLVNVAEKSVGLSGTLFGGVASSLYLLLFMFSRHIREQYPFGAGGMTQFIEDMGVLEEIVEDRPQYENGVYSGTKRYESGAKEAPGCSPRLVVETLPCTVFAGLPDIGIDMPKLVETPLAVDMESDLEQAYVRGEEQLKAYLQDLRYTGKQWTFMGAYLQALMNYPDACAHAYPVYHQENECLVWTLPELGEERIFAKEQTLIDLVRDELAEGRNVTIFVRQTGKRDIQRRLAQLLQTHVPGANPYILYGGSSGTGDAEDNIASANVPTAQREKALQSILDKGHNILLCNPLLIQTGLDLIQFPTLIFFEPLFSLYPMDQASRRHWRIIQTRECRTIYLYYAGTMEERALELVAKKREAAQLLYGDMSADGLAALTGDGGIANDLMKALENILRTPDETLEASAEGASLQDLFARTSLASYESPWTLAVQAEGVQATPQLWEPEVLPIESTPLPLLEVNNPCPDEVVLPNRTLQPLPPRRKMGKRQLDLSRAPETGASPLFTEITIEVTPVADIPVVNEIPILAKKTLPPPLPPRSKKAQRQLELAPVTEALPETTTVSISTAVQLALF